MKSIKSLFSLALICIAFIPSASAKIRLPQIIGDNMILQQKNNAKIWGWASPGEVIKIKCSWNNQIVTATASKDSSWIAYLKTPEGSYASQKISIASEKNKTDKIDLKNILIGEVWFASGQSNMEMPLNGFTSCPVAGANQEIAFSGEYKNKIHFVTIPKTAARTPQKEVEGKWQEASPETSPWFSATGWFFATTLNKSLNVPIGIINCSWGGSKVEGWLNEETLKNYPDIDLSKVPNQKYNVHYLTPLVMYNGMAHPLIGYTIHGFIWYQGESNIGKSHTYSDRLSTLIKLWRSEWKQGDLPFYYVEIAPFNYGDKDQGALLREAQYKVQNIVSNCGMISTNDLASDYELNQIHPHNKKAVGERLAYMALHNAYNEKFVECRGPEYQSMNIDGDKAIIKFKYDENGFNRSNGIKGFEIAGSDSIFHPANATVDATNKTVIVNSPEVQVPVAVRYAFKDFSIGNFANTRELPAVPFRTDNW